MKTSRRLAAVLLVLALVLPASATAQVTLTPAFVWMDCYATDRCSSMTAMMGVRASRELGGLSIYAGGFWRGTEASYVGRRPPPSSGVQAVAGLGRRFGGEGGLRPYLLAGLGAVVWRGDRHADAALVEGEAGLHVPLLGRAGLVLGGRVERRLRREPTLFGAFGGVSVRVGG